VVRNVRKSRPRGANYNSPALQRREKWEKWTKSRRDDGNPTTMPMLYATCAG
jgi:hypothetical protein